MAHQSPRTVELFHGIAMKMQGVNWIYPHTYLQSSAKLIYAGNRMLLEGPEWGPAQHTGLPNSIVRCCTLEVQSESPFVTSLASQYLVSTARGIGWNCEVPLSLKISTPGRLGGPSLPL